MTYTALLSLAILRDDFSRLDRRGLVEFLRACQTENGSFTTVPKSGDTDLRTLYCAFAISILSGEKLVVKFAQKTDSYHQTYEGGYGQYPHCEASGGPTYVAIASLHLTPSHYPRLNPEEVQKSVHWLIHNQSSCGGFSGRTNKEADACYCFWCGATLKILGAGHLVDYSALSKFVADCQFKFGGIAKSPGEGPAALSIYPPPLDMNGSVRTSWEFDAFDPLLNARHETAKWMTEF
ncbi:hypothetical protein MPER_11355, partial [Moniliophthora perniciosa FA553]